MPATLEQPDQTIPKSAGTYALILLMPAGRSIQVGKLGLFDFPAGYYIYIGSAFGPGGLAGRLGRHLSPAKPGSPAHWHIDYLRRQAPIVEIWFSDQNKPREHDWATLINGLPESCLPAPRFGASDCRCPAHLYHFKARPSAADFQAALNLNFPADQPLCALRLSEKTIE
jgi:Uri superfamily endonuclease